MDYAHTPDAIENVLNSMDKNAGKTNYNDTVFPAKKIITIIGAGGDRDSSKRPFMAKIACENSDKVFLTSDNPRFENPEKILNDMERGVKENFSNYEIIEDRKEAIFSALTWAEKFSKKNDTLITNQGVGPKIVVAILGKGNEDYLDIEGKKYPYSDKEEVLSFFKK
jgi:UDP-N-acetylmuramoyl-L-alanyl-D-glutamate--2,6-diaminopimelate ligase